MNKQQCSELPQASSSEQQQQAPVDNTELPRNDNNNVFCFDDSPFKCKANCGFFGNPEWSGYCSLCYKSLNQKRLQEHIDQQEQQSSPNNVLLQQTVGKIGLTNIMLTGYNTLSSLPSTLFNSAKLSLRASSSSSLFNRSQSPQNTTSTSQHNQDQSNLGGDKLSISSGNNLSSIDSRNTDSSSTHMNGSLDPSYSYDAAWTECYRCVSRFAKEFIAHERSQKKSLIDLSDMVHDFYQHMKHRIETSSTFKNIDSVQQELLMDNMERVLNEQIYFTISIRLINEDEDHIIAVQKKIRSLNWVTIDHLDIKINMEHPDVNILLDKAICQMIEINSRQSSIEKLESIVQCSKTIAEILSVARTGPVSADQFLPLLVFVVIQANPPMLPTDIKYLNRFSNVTKLLSGETGYYFTNLCCALEFIEKASGASLNISQEDFERLSSGVA